MLVELVRVVTRDGCQLDGALRRPAAAGACLVDAVVMVHGTGSNFYSSSFFDFLTEEFLKQGVAVLRINTRGHDGISTAVTQKGGLRLGAAFEIVDDCRHDLLAWADFLRQNVGRRVLLLGHSMGAVKCLHATAQEGDLEPVGLIALSPPRLSYEWFCKSDQADTFLASCRQAEELCGQGQSQTLIESQVPLPMIISAGGFIDKYGPEERYHFLPMLRLIPCPTLFTFGAIEVAKNVAFQGLPEAVAEKVAKRNHFEIETVPGADHFYTGVRPAVWERIGGWLQRRFATK